MDEVGRGTSTFDGLSLAWASAAHLAEHIGAFTLFATHYFEMTALPENHSNVVNVHLKATEHDDRIIFLHSVEQGPASQSYGLQVAQLAGVPDSVIQQAKAQLLHLEQSSGVSPAAIPTSFTSGAENTAPVTHKAAKADQPLQNDLFAALPSAVEERLAALNPDDLSPRAALELMYELKALL